MSLVDNTPVPLSSLTLAERVQLGAADSSFYARSFFPRAFRQPSPEAHRIMWSHLENPRHRYVNFRCFRGSGKTTLARTYTSKRIAYGLSKTVLYIGASEPHASRSVVWLRNNLLRNKPWTTAFGLRLGSKWNETQLEIIQELPGMSEPNVVNVLGAGITGNVRGINFDDYRPDTIILDDTITDENAATLEQRSKINTLILGALKESLAPATEEPNAKFANLQTPMHPEDAASKMVGDPMFKTVSLPCWTDETIELPLEFQESSWPERFPSETLRGEKLAAVARNELSVFAREMECRLITPELASFRPTWLRYYEQAPTGSYNILVIDPVPPPSERQMAKGLRGKDFEAHVVTGRKNGEYFWLDVRSNRGHEPNWTVATAIEMAERWNITKICLLAVGYETVLESMLRREMARKGVYTAIQIVPLAGRSKFVRITAATAGTASQGKLWTHQSFTDLNAQFAEYGPTYSGYDDLLEAGAAGIELLANPYIEMSSASGDDDRGEMESDFEYSRRAP